MQPQMAGKETRRALILEIPDFPGSVKQLYFTVVFRPVQPSLDGLLSFALSS